MQKEGDESKRDAVVLLLQDMLEVVTRDMMVNESRYISLSLLHSKASRVRILTNWKKFQGAGWAGTW